MLADLFDFLVADEGAVQAGDASAARHIEHVALAQQLLAALFAQDGAAVDLRRDLEGDPGREVGLDGAGDDVHRRALRGHDKVDARRARHLGQTLDGAFDVLARDQHQVGHLVHDHDQIGHGLGTDLLALVDGAALFVEAGLDGAFEMLALFLSLAGALVVAGDVADAELGHPAIAVLHLAHGPLQGHDRLLGIGHDRRQQVRDAVIDRQLQHLGVDHDETALGGRVAIQDRQDHGVDPDRLARAGGARDQQVGHPRQVGDIGLAADGFAQRQRQQMALLVVFARGQKVAQEDGLALGVGQFDADGVAALDHADAAGAGRHGAGDVVRQGHDAAVLHAGRRHQLIQGDDGAGADLVDLAAHAEFLEHALQHLGVGLQRLLVDGAAALAGLGQNAQRRQLEAAFAREVEGLLVRVAAHGLGRLDRRDLGLGRTAGAGRGRGDGGGGRVLPRRGVGVRLIGVGLVIGGGDRSARGGRRAVGLHLVRLGQTVARLAGRGGGFGDGARRLARLGGFGRSGGAGLGALLGGPASGVGEVAQTQAHGIGQTP